MSKFLHGLWWVITFPFRAIWWIITLPFRALSTAKSFMQTEPEEHPLGDVFVDLTQNSQARQLFWDQVEALRGHLLRVVLGIIIGVAIAALFTEQLVQFLAVPLGGLDRLMVIEPPEQVGLYM